MLPLLARFFDWPTWNTPCAKCHSKESSQIEPYVLRFSSDMLYSALAISGKRVNFAVVCMVPRWV